MISTFCKVFSDPTIVNNCDANKQLIAARSVARTVAVPHLDGGLEPAALHAQLDPCPATARVETFAELCIHET